MPDDLLQQAIALCKAGEKYKADLLLRHILRRDPHNQTAWLWLADAQPDAQSRLRMLRAFLRANPENPVAQQAVKRFSAQEKPAAVTTPASPQNLRPKDPPPALGWKLPLYVFGAIVCLGMLVFLVIGLLRMGQVAPAGQLPLQTAPAGAQATLPPRQFPTPQASPTPDACGCAEAQAYLERSAERLAALQKDMLAAAGVLESQVEGRAEFATLSGLGRARYEQQHADPPPQCLTGLHQKMVTYFASWWHAMESFALGDYYNAAAFLTSFREKEAEIYAEAQTWLEQFQQCAPPEDDPQDQIG